MHRTGSGFLSSDLSAAEVLPEITGEPCVLVRIVQTQGSAPRDSGTWMLVLRDRCYNTIGGGHLEFEAIHQARDLLQYPNCEPVEKSFTLGASLGQCCGGVVRLRFDSVPEVQREAFFNEATAGLDAGFGTIAIIGGGHVGHAIVQAALPLPFSVFWADSREEIFPAISHPRLITQSFEDISQSVAEIPRGSALLVMSFNHAEDFDVVRAALKKERDEPGYFSFIGLIGSKTKWAKFRHRLSERGFTVTEIAKVTCPIGILQIKSKVPAVIAASVIAQLLIHCGK